MSVPSDGIRVSYGNILSHGSDASVRGGRVKLTHLHEAFSESRGAFNLLYLVSSAQPPFVDELARWARGRGIKVVWNQDGVAYPAWAGREADGLNATIAWIYVFLRIVHSIWQATVNRVMVRFALFSLSSLALIALILHAAMAIFHG